MKKLLSAILAVLMLASCILTAALSVSAIEQPEDYEEILLNMPDENGQGPGLGWWVGMSAVEQDGLWGMGKTYTANVTGGHVVTGFCPSNVIDITDMEQLEFDIYVSSAVPFQTGHTTLELNSAPDQGGYGRRDKNELEVNMNGGWKLQEGWNHVIYSLTTSFEPSGKGTFDPANFNCFSIVRHSGITLDEGEPFTVILRNVKFTKGGLTAEEIFAATKAEFDAAQPELVGALSALEPIKEMKDVTKANRDDIKAKIDLAEEKLAALTAEETQTWKTLGYADIFNVAKTALTEYDAKVEEHRLLLEQHKALIDTINALPTEITDANYEEAKAAIEKAGDDYNDLGKSAREALTEAGVLATLEAAEQLLREFVPTTVPGGDDGENGENEENGCASMLSIGAGATLLLAGAYVALATRKKED